jgi:hypothetical protein
MPHPRVRVFTPASREARQARDGVPPTFDEGADRSIARIGHMGRRAIDEAKTELASLTQARDRARSKALDPAAPAAIVPGARGAAP